jgi:nucleoside-diphosphate-sugar epimerase
MNVTFIGAGNMGRGIGHRLVAGGHDVAVVDRDPEEAGRPRRGWLNSCATGGCGPSTWALWSALGTLRVWGSSG